MRIEELYKIYLQHPFVQTDSRKIKKGDIFFALKGTNFNGNDFAKQAIDAGAVYAVIDEKEFEIPGKTILVDDVLSSLQQLATFHRKKFLIPFLAITGSNGKTTTKELIHAVLSNSYKTYTTEGNLNNHIGIPLTLLKIKDDAEIAVIEMGANHIGEIASYCNIVLPTHGIITNCGKAHLEGFGNEEGVRKGKGELFDFLRSHDGTAFVMQDYDYLMQMSKGIPNIVRYGIKTNSFVNGKVLSSDPFLKTEINSDNRKKIIQTHLFGEYNLPNVLAAFTIGKFFKVPEEKIRSAIENYIPSNSRSQLIIQGNNKIILDAYNANPASMKLAIENFSKMPGDKILILGSMAELGAESEKEHREIIELIKKYNWKEVLLAGKEFEKTKHPFHQFNTSLEIKNWLQQKNLQNVSMLIKGSRTMQMEKVIVQP